MGAVTVAFVKRNVVGGVARSAVVDVTFSGTYAAGGDTFTPSQFGMTSILAMVPMGSAFGSATTAYVVSPDLANNKIKLMASAAAGTAPTETAAAGQIATVARMLVIGDFPYV